MNHEDPAVGHRAESKHPQFRRMVGGHFDEGADYSTWRTCGTDDWLLLHTLAGEGRVASTRVELRAGGGDAILIPPHARHDYGTAPGSASWDFLFAHFRPPADWSPLLDWPGLDDGISRVHLEGSALKRVTEALHRSVRRARSPFESAELFAMNALEEALLWIDTRTGSSRTTDDRVLRVVEYVNAHLSDRLDLSVLADVAALSPSRLTRLFTSQLGVSPQKFVERERMHVAKQLLDFTNRPIGAIARDVGWEDPLYFSQRFRHVVGSSPTDYRRRG